MFLVYSNREEGKLISNWGRLNSLQDFSVISIWEKETPISNPLNEE